MKRWKPVLYVALTAGLLFSASHPATAQTIKKQLGSVFRVLGWIAGRLGW